MIGYPIAQADLEARIEATAPGWIDRARTKTAEFKAKGKYEEASSIWSEVKPVYMALQGGAKCIYCERKLESADYGKGEQDVEHFRPKNKVRTWKTPKNLSDRGIATSPAPTGSGGYYLLPYHVFNYSAACKPCNSALKSDLFPIAGTYDLQNDDPVALLKELPFLIYPIGDFDANPESLIRFHGVSPQPAAAAGHERNRALVTIEFFKLDDAAKRKNLIRERAAIIVALFPQLEFLSGGTAAQKRAARKLVDGFTADNAAHANCARSYVRLHGADRAEAQAVFERAVELIASGS